MSGDISYSYLQFTGFPNNGIPGLRNGSQGFLIHFRETRANLKKLGKRLCTYLGTLLHSDTPVLCLSLDVVLSHSVRQSSFLGPYTGLASWLTRLATFL